MTAQSRQAFELGKGNSFVMLNSSLYLLVVVNIFAERGRVKFRVFGEDPFS